MQRALIWVLPLLVLTIVGCGPEQGEGEAPADTETVASDAQTEEEVPGGPIADPRSPKEVWPLVLVQRDRARKLMGKKDIWHEDLPELEREIMTLLRLVGEVADWVSQNPSPDIDYSDVARSRSDVRVAVAPIRSAIIDKAPGMWRQLAPDVDDALRLMEMRFPDGLGESVADRPNYMKHLFESS